MKATRSNVVINLYLELKYCERCGNLGLRRAGADQVYCESCSRQMDEMSPASRDGGSDEREVGFVVPINRRGGRA